MNVSFRYDSPVSGHHFLSRGAEVDRICNILSAGSAVIYGEPGVGCRSLALASLSAFRLMHPDVLVVNVDLLRCRTTEDVITTYADAVLKSVGASAQDYRKLVEKYLSGTHAVFDVEQFASHGSVVSMNWMVDAVDLERIIFLPFAVAKDKKIRMLLYLSQFQNILFCEDNDLLLRMLEKAVREHTEDCSVLFTGSQFNRLREIFDTKRFFWRTAVRIIPSKIEASAIVDHVFKGFQNQGKVLDRSVIIWAVDVLRSNLRYINQLFSIVDGGSKGYVSSDSVREGLEMLLGANRDRFIAAVNSLTDFQLRLLKAVIDGETRFSATPVIEKYRLNSSANVKRLKDALAKKEIVWFDDEDVPHIEDALFELWLRKEYFAQ